jgi:hypothetical protein
MCWNSGRTSVIQGELKVSVNTSEVGYRPEWTSHCNYVQIGPEITVPLPKAELDILFNYPFTHKPFLIGASRLRRHLSQTNWILRNARRWVKFVLISCALKQSESSLTLYSTVISNSPCTVLMITVRVGRDFFDDPSEAIHTIFWIGRPHFQHSATPLMYRSTVTLRSPCIMQTELEHQSRWLRLTKPFTFISMSAIFPLESTQEVYFHSKCFVPPYPIWKPKSENKHN